ncbi:hypothetical protein KOW79_017763 [Hemibagrus wyckioides]|uniref:Uncharacterized protein n=1 Tax=Hemibagrus wyckioides TaxID=337641 RepID=A0A9D3ND40_9TELE|nr:hypothetical protein KOW79_017763 [Hemibagrus wyckioides]
MGETCEGNGEIDSGRNRNGSLSCRKRGERKKWAELPPARGGWRRSGGAPGTHRAVKPDAAVFNWTLFLPCFLLLVTYHGLTERREVCGLCLSLSELCFVLCSDTFSICRRRT